MRSRAIILSFILLLSISYIMISSFGESEPSEEETVNVWLVLLFRDYETDMPIPNVPVTASISTAWGEKQIEPTSTNETGVVQVFLGAFLRASPTSQRLSRLLGLAIFDNYTLIKVNDFFMEDAEYTAEYMPNSATYADMQINLRIESSESRIFLEADLWVLKGKLIKVSDCDPLTGKRMNLSAKPAVRAVIESEGESTYESYFFFPINYNVTVILETEPRTEQIYPPIEVRIEENTTMVNWMYHAAEAYLGREMLRVSEEIEWFRSLGFPVDRETEEYLTIQDFLSRVLSLYQKREYGPSLGGAKISIAKLNNLKKWLPNLKTYAVLTSIGVCLFAYALASLLPSFIFEERGASKARLASKIIIFSLFLFIFSLTNPSVRITYVLLIERVFGVVTRRMDLFSSLWGCLFAGSLTYFVITLISIKKAPMRNLALQLGIRDLKRRRSRTILNLISISIIVSSAIIFVNISMGYTTKIRNSWIGTETQGIIIQADTYVAPLSEYDINWTGTQEWCMDLGYREEIRKREHRQGFEIARQSLLLVDNRLSRVHLVGIDPAFMEKYYNFTNYVRGIWQDFHIGEPVIIVPTSLDVPIGEYVELDVEEVVYGPTGSVSRGRRPLGSFRVVGKFDSAALSKLIKIDGNPLFEDTMDLVLVPVKSTTDPSVVISEATIMLDDGFDVVAVAEKLAYMLGVAAIANRDGIAMLITWSFEFSIAGFMPYLFPLTITGLMVYVTMASVYQERKREFIVLATLGLDPGNTFQVFIVETLVLGIMAAILGFFGSYILLIVLSYLRIFLGFYGLSSLPFTYAQWSASSVLVALFIGVVVTFLGGYIPAAKAQGLSLLGRRRTRQFLGELISYNDITRFNLPIKETIQNSEILYTYIRETIGKFKPSRVDPHSIKGEIRRDGSFSVSFTAFSGARGVFIPCEIKGVKDGESLGIVLEFPTKHRQYEKIRVILRDLERYMIGFAAWKEIQLRMKIIREAPRRRKTLEEIMSEVKEIINQIKDCNRKLKILEAQKNQLSEEVYDEFRQKYISRIEEISKGLRSSVVNLEPYYNELQEEIKKVEIEIERITTAHNLGEITEEEYIKTGSPLQARHAALKGRINELEEIFEFLRMPSRIT